MIKANLAKIYLFVLLLSLLLLFHLYQSSGICFSKLEILSDINFMETALKPKFDNGELLIGIEDTSVRAFLSNHPDCCYVFKRKNIFNLYGLLPAERSVYLKFPLSKKAMDSGFGGGGTYYEQEIDLSACGDISHIENLGGFTPKK